MNAKVSDLSFLRQKLQSRIEQLRKELGIVEQCIAIAEKHTGKGASTDSLSDDLSIEGPFNLKSRSGYGEAGALVRKAIEHCPEHYTVKDVVAEVAKQGGPQLTQVQVATVLSRLARLKEIHVFEAGGGRRPARYSKTAKQDKFSGELPVEESR